MQIRFDRNRTSTGILIYSLYLYFLGLSLRNTSKALVIFRDENKIRYVSIELELDTKVCSYSVYNNKLSITELE